MDSIGDIGDYRNIRWDSKTLEDFIKDDFIEGRNGDVILEYKSGEWITFDQNGRISREKKREIRKYIAAISNMGGGFFIIGIPEKEKHPLPPVGIPITKWGQFDHIEHLRGIISEGIFPRLFPFPKIYLIELRDGIIREVIIFEIYETVHSFHKVLDDGGRTYLYHEDNVIQADQWLEKLLWGERGRKAVPILTHKSELDIRGDPDTSNLWHFFQISNHSSISLNHFTIGIVISRNEVTQSRFKFINPKFDNKDIKEYTVQDAIPVPIRQFFIDVSQPHIRITTMDVPLLPFQEILFKVGYESLSEVPKVHVGFWIVGENMNEPIVCSFISTHKELERPILENMEGPPFIWNNLD